MEVQAPTEDNLRGEEAIRLGREWPTEHDDTTHLKRGYYRRDNGTLGKVVDGVRLTESEDDYSSSHSAKRAKMGFCASESDPSDVGSPKVEASKDDKYDENAGAQEKDDDKEKIEEEKFDNVEGDGEDSSSSSSSSSSASSPSPSTRGGVPFRSVCRQTVGIDDDGNEEECGGETDGCSQICHSCKQAMKRGWFAYGMMR